MTNNKKLEDMAQEFYDKRAKMFDVNDFNRETITVETYKAAYAAAQKEAEGLVSALNTALNYLHWRADDLIGDDCKGDGKLTATYKNRIAEIESALKKYESGE